MTTAAEHRAEAVAAIHALADLLQNNPNLPVPQSIRAQHTIISGLTPDGEDLIRRTAAELGVDAQFYDHDGKPSAIAEYQVGRGYSREHGSWSVSYVIHGSREKQDAQLVTGEVPS